MLAKSVLDHQSTDFGILWVRIEFCPSKLLLHTARARSSTILLSFTFRVIKNNAYLMLRYSEEWTVLKLKKN